MEEKGGETLAHVIMIFFVFLNHSFIFNIEVFNICRILLISSKNTYMKFLLALH